MALDMPVYMAVGEGLTTCIRVYVVSACCASCIREPIKDDAPSAGQLDTSPSAPIASQRAHGDMSRAVPYGNACKGACDHVRGQREVRW